MLHKTGKLLLNVRNIHTIGGQINFRVGGGGVPRNRKFWSFLHAIGIVRSNTVSCPLEGTQQIILNAIIPAIHMCHFIRKYIEIGS